MINNINNLNTNSVLEVNSLLEFCKTFVFKNKYVADNNETKISLYNSSYYVRASTNPSSTIPSNIPPFILDNIIGNTNLDIISLYIKNTYYSIKSDSFSEDNYFAELNSYYRDLFINYYNNIITKYGDTEQSYEYNIAILQTLHIAEYEKLLLYIFECRIYNHLDILYYDNDYIDVVIFFKYYVLNKTYFLKTIYTEGFEIQENYFNFCKFFIVFMTIQNIINKKMEIVFDIDVLDEYSIINLLYSYGIYFLDDLPVYYQKRVIKNIQRLLSNKGNNQVIANILDIFEMPDETVFKHYMEKRYTGTNPSDIKTVGIPYNEYSYINYIDSGKKVNNKPFYYYTKDDKSWKTEKEFILNPANNVDFDYIQTKYLSIDSSFDIQTFAAECSFFFDTIYRSKSYQNNIFTQDKIRTNYSFKGFDIFDGIIGLATLAILINGAEPIIFKSNFLNSRHAFLDGIDYDIGLFLNGTLISPRLYTSTGEPMVSNSFTNTGLDISKYFSIDSMKVKNTKDITTNVLSNLDFRKDLENIICDTTDYYDFRNLVDTHKKLFQADTNRSFFTEHNNYLDYLKDNCISLYNLINPLTKKLDENELIKTFGMLAVDLERFLETRRLVWDVPYREFLFKYLYYMIDYFKSYTVQLDRFKILFRFNNELENRLFLLDRTQTTSMFKVADLVGGELFEFQERPLSLYDNFSREIEIDPFGTKYVYRDMSSILKMKDTNRLKFTDNCIISIIE